MGPRFREKEDSRFRGNDMQGGNDKQGGNDRQGGINRGIGNDKKWYGMEALTEKQADFETVGWAFT